MIQPKGGHQQGIGLSTARSPAVQDFILFGCKELRLLGVRDPDWLALLIPNLAPRQCLPADLLLQQRSQLHLLGIRQSGDGLSRQHQAWP